jgi:hypothetical protein
MTPAGIGLIDSAGYSSTLISDAASGSMIKVDQGSDLTFGAFSAGDAASHVIECDGSLLRLNGVIAEYSTPTITGAGLYLHSNARVEMANTINPAVDGVIGDVTFDGLYETCTWASAVATPHEYAGSWIGEAGIVDSLIKIQSISPKGAMKFSAFVEEEVTLSLVALGTDTAAAFPASAFNRTVATRVTEEITGGGVAAVQVGDGTTPAVFGALSALTVGTADLHIPATDASVVLTNTPVTFTADAQPTQGKIRIIMSWDELRVPQA